MSDNLNTSNSNPNWKSYSETNDVDDIIKATDFNNEFSIKVDQNNGYSLNQNLVKCSIDNTSTLRGLKQNILVNDLVNFYSNFNVISDTWTPSIRIISSLAANTNYTSSGNYILANNILYYWGNIVVTDIGVVTGIISSGNMTFNTIYSTTNVASNNISSTGGTGNGATFNITSKNVYKVSSILMNNPGINYSINDVLTLTNNAGFATVTSVTTAGNILNQTYTLSTTPLMTNMAGTNLASTGGNGTGATFDITSNAQTLFTPASITLNNAGENYAVNDTITLTNIGVVTVLTVGDNGSISTISSKLSNVEQTTDMSGSAVSGVTSGSGSNATFTVTSTSGTYYTPSTITINSKGTGYSVNDQLTVKDSSGNIIATINVLAVTSAGQISTVSINMSQNYNDTDVSGNNISSTGGKGTGATFNVTTNLFYTYDKIIINNGGTNYLEGDSLTIGDYGTYVVTGISSADGNISISGLPYESVQNFSFNCDVNYFNGYIDTSKILYMSSKNNYLNLYSNQQNTLLSTSMLNKTFSIQFSGWFPVNS